MFHKQYIVAILLLALLAPTIKARDFQSYGHKKHPTLDDHCYFKDHNLTIKVNETIFPTNIEDYCYKMFCRRFEDDYVIDVSFCPGATLVCGKRDYSKPFPECCGICE
uniref:Single domain-containing protein n=1 Tax=Stomoxys calcitrans TaxID=35570 RepID=A0A1I8Q0X9_STOCA